MGFRERLEWFAQKKKKKETGIKMTAVKISTVIAKSLSEEAIYKNPL